MAINEKRCIDEIIKYCKKRLVNYSEGKGTRRVVKDIIEIICENSNHHDVSKIRKILSSGK